VIELKTDQMNPEKGRAIMRILNYRVLKNGKMDYGILEFFSKEIGAS
jgi:hypothetical protein